MRMKAIKLFLAITVYIPLISLYPAYAEEGREKVIIRLPEFIIFSEEQLQEAPPVKPEKAAPFKDLKGLKDDVPTPDSMTTPDAKAKENLKKTKPPQALTGWVYGNSVALFLATITGDEPADEALFKSGLHFYKNEEYKKAVEAFKKLIRKYPKSEYVSASSYWLAESYYAAGNLKDALDAYEDTIKKYPESDYWDYAHYSLGWLYVNEGDYNKAVFYFTKATKSPVSSLAYSAQFWVGDCLMRLKKYEDAIKVFHTLTYSGITSKQLNEKTFSEGIEKFVDGKENYREFISRFPFPQSLLINTALYGLGVSGRGMEAGGISFQRSDIKGIKNVVWGININTDIKYLEAAMYRTALAHIALNRMEKAREEAKRLKQMNPQTNFSDYIEFEAGAHYYKNKNKKDALKIFQFLAKNTLQPDLAPVAEFMVGEILYQDGKVSEALSSYEKAEKNQERPLLSIIASYKSSIILYQRHEYEGVLKKLLPVKGKSILAKHKDDINYLIAESLSALGKYDEALSSYQTIPNTSPLNEKVQYGRAWVYYKKGLFKEAVESFNIFMDKYPKSPLREDALFRIADSYLGLKDFSAYYKAYVQLIKEYPAGSQNSWIALQAGLVMYKEEKFEDAAAVFKNIAARAPKSKEAEEASFRLGWSFFRMNDYKKSVSEFSNHINNYPQSPFTAEAFLKIGDSYYNLKEYAKALEHYNNVKYKHHKSPFVKDAEYGAILAHKQLGNSEAARTEAERFVKKNPKAPISITLQFQTAEELEAKKKLGEALLAYRTLLSISETSEFSDIALYRIGRILFETREFHNSISSLNQLINNYPKSAYLTDARLKIAESYSQVADYENAILNLKKFVSLYPDNANAPDAIFKTAAAYDRLKKTDDAIKTYKEFLAKFPEHKSAPNAYLSMAQYYRNDKMDKKTAAVYYQNATELQNEEIAAEAQYNLGELALAEGRSDDAKIEFMKTCYLYPKVEKWGSLAQLKTAEIFEKEKKQTAAFALYQRIIDKSKNKEAVQASGEKIKDLKGAAAQ